MIVIFSAENVAVVKVIVAVLNVAVAEFALEKTVITLLVIYLFLDQPQVNYLFEKY